MADWTNIPDTALDPDAPLTSDLGYAWRDNVIAAAEGAVSAPYSAVEWHPYNGSFIGDGLTGRIWSFAVDGAVASIETPNFIDGYEYMLKMENLSVSSGTGRLFYVSFFRETSAAFSPDITLLTPLDFTQSFSGHFEIYRPREVFRFHTGKGNILVDATDSVANTNTQAYAVVQHTTAQKILRARINFSGGNFDAGAVYLYRRRVY